MLEQSDIPLFLCAGGCVRIEPLLLSRELPAQVSCAERCTLKKGIQKKPGISAESLSVHALRSVNLQLHIRSRPISRQTNHPV